jgi:PAS domain S-box-containing protein
MRFRVLVVEDNRDLAENIQELFADLGAAVEVASDSERALSRAQEVPYDLALVDVRLPSGVSGLDLVPALKERSPMGEVILITGNATLQTAITAVRRGVFAYLQKPFDPDDLLALGQRALEQARIKKERQELARELARSEALHRSVVEGVESLIVGMDPDHAIRMWNRAAVERLGHSADRALGANGCELLAVEDDRPRLHRAAVRAREEGVTSSLQIAVLTADGIRRVIDWLVLPLSPEGSATPLVLLVGTDVSERLYLEARAAEAEAMAAMGRLTAGLAHEIRNPLNAAALQLELMGRSARRLEDAKAREKIGTRVDIVKSELTRLNQLLDEFLGLARPDHLQLGPVSLHRVVEEVGQLQAPVAEAAGLSLTWEIEEDLPSAHGDEGKLKQAMVNLVVNAIDAMGEAEEGAIRLTARRAGEGLELTVEDEGPGFEDTAENVFRPFVTTKKGGTGLGLPIVKKIVEMHGGEVRLEAREPRGTTVRLALRVAEARRRESQLPPEAQG